MRGRAPKKTLIGGDSSASQIPIGGSTSVGVIGMVRRLVLTAGVALRAIPGVFETFGGLSDPTAVIPSASGARWWLQRLGLFALQEKLEVADEGVYLIDHSVQIGTVKVCVIVGLRLSELPSPARPLRQEDLRLLATIPTESSTGEKVAEQLQQTAQRTGIPREIVSDHGSDVKKGSELFAARHPHTAVVYDAAHHGACVLKRRFEADPRWADFLTPLNQTNSRLQQTSDAYLMSPNLRPKARYMNVASVLRWCRAMLVLLDRGTTSGPASARAQVRYGWLRRDRRAIAEWSRWESTVRGGVEFVRTHGLSRGSPTELAAHLRARPSAERHRKIEAELVEFVRRQSTAAQPGERLVGSTEVLESVFGKWKSLERQESQSGITGLVLSLGALLGNWTTSRIQTALNQTPVKQVTTWCKTHLPPSVQSLRRLAFSTPLS